MRANLRRQEIFPLQTSRVTNSTNVDRNTIFVISQVDHQK